MNKHTKQVVLDALWRIKRSEAVYMGAGICYVILVELQGDREEGWPCRTTDDEYQSWMQWRDHRFKEWPEFSGSLVYPVLGWGWYQVHAATEELRVRKYWTGEFGSARIRLLNFLIRKLEKELAE